MKRLLLSLAFISVGAVVEASVAKTVQSQANWQDLANKVQRFHDYYGDFVSFAKSHIGEGMEFEIANHLGIIAHMNQERVGAANALIDIYENVSCEKDRSLVKFHLKEQLEYDVKILDLDIEDVNNALSHTTLPAISQTAIRMKDDLRDVRAKLDALRSSLE